MDVHKKKDRKKRRFAARLKSSKGVSCVEISTANIVLCNAGQATGLNKEKIQALCENHDLNIFLPKLIAEKGESHSYLVFRNVQDAEAFYRTFNDTINAKFDEQGSPIYMSFVDKVPKNEIMCPFDDPEGLYVLQNFITAEEELSLIRLFDWNENLDSNLKNRQVKHFGYEFRYGSNDVDLSNPLQQKIPKECNYLWQKLKEHGFNVGIPNQLTVNKYLPGQGIPSHVDKHSPFDSTILSLSLGSSVVMDWRHHSGKYAPVLLRARSMMVMQGEARYDWQHGITPRNWDPVIEVRQVQSATKELSTVKVLTNDTVQRGVRISLTFRWAKSGPCLCPYKMLCDTAAEKRVEIEDDVASNLEALHVHEVYEQIATHFSTTRHKPWPKVVEFMKSVPAGSVVVDLGCGNGKNILDRNDILQLACERSSGLLSECQQHTSNIGTASCVRLDALKPGLRTNCADALICIAVLHHFSTKGRRLQALSAIREILRPSGRALITVWSKDQTKSNYLAKNKEVNNSEIHMNVGGVKLPVHENRTQFKHQDLLVPWKLRTVKQNKLSNQPENTLLRYYHVFEEKELDKLCEDVGLAVEDTFYEEGNWCVVVKKK